MDKLGKQITRSEYSWEREALEYVRARLPDHGSRPAAVNSDFGILDGPAVRRIRAMTSVMGKEVKKGPGATGVTGLL